MEAPSRSYIERLGLALLALIYRERLPLLSGLGAGLLAHMFMLTNKLVNHDDIESLFYKGATVTSGRWGLELSHYIFPNISMPWIYGVLALILLASAACIMLHTLKVERALHRIMIPALILSFPSLTGTFCFMFTAAPYALAFFLSALGAWLISKGGRGRWCLAVVCIVLCLSIYQAYIAVTAALLVALMLRRTLEGDEIGQVLIFGFKALGLMLLALAVYFGLTLLSFAITGQEFNSYVIDNVNGQAGILGRLRLAYENFRDIFTYGNYSLVASPLSHWAHLALLAFMALELAILCSKFREPIRWALAFGLALLLPLAINCMYLAMAPASIHSLVLYSFVALYLLAASLAELLEPPLAPKGRDCLALILAVILAGNVYFANKVYLKLHLQYETASSFYTSMIAQIKATPGFDSDSKLAIIGTQDNALFYPQELDSSLLLGPSKDLVNIYSRERLFRYYLGFDVPFASQEELEAIEEMEEFQAMAEYPYYGSVQELDGYIVVKLG